MKASQLINGIIASRYPQSIVMPNCIPNNWWECDVLEIMKSGFWYEYEIKVSRSDFRADAKKAKFFGNKHELLAGNKRGPNRFFFVTLKVIVTEDDIPEWAGWYETYTDESRSPTVRVIKRKDAPDRHRNKMGTTALNKIKTNAYHRYINYHIAQTRKQAAA